MAEQTTPDDRPFTEVAARLALWRAVQDAATPGHFLRAWELAGFHLFYVDGLPYPSVSMPTPPMLRADLLPVAFLPAWVATAPPTYRDGLLEAFARQWEADDRQDVIARFWQGLAAVLADELGRADLAPGV